MNDLYTQCGCIQQVGDCVLQFLNALCTCSSKVDVVKKLRSLLLHMTYTMGVVVRAHLILPCQSE